MPTIDATDYGNDDKDDTDEQEQREVIEVDQWSSSGDIDKFTFDELKEIIEACDEDEVPRIEGGDAEAIQQIFGGNYEVKTVAEDATPRKAMVWYVEGDDGELERWKYNFATK